MSAQPKNIQVSVSRKVEVKPSTHIRMNGDDVFTSSETVTYSLSGDFEGGDFDAAKQQLQGKLDQWCEEAKQKYGGLDASYTRPPPKSLPPTTQPPTTNAVAPTLTNLGWFKFGQGKGVRVPCGRGESGWAKAQYEDKAVDAVARDLFNRIYASGADSIVLSIDGVEFRVKLSGQDGNLFNRFPVKEGSRR